MRAGDMIDGSVPKKSTLGFFSGFFLHSDAYEGEMDEEEEDDDYEESNGGRKRGMLDFIDDAAIEDGEEEEEDDDDDQEFGVVLAGISRGKADRSSLVLRQVDSDAEEEEDDERKTFYMFTSHWEDWNPASWGSTAQHQPGISTRSYEATTPRSGLATTVEMHEVIIFHLLQVVTVRELVCS